MPRRNNMRGGNRIWNQNNDNRYNANQFGGVWNYYSEKKILSIFIPRHFGWKFPLKFCQIKFLFLEHDDRGENVGKQIHRTKNTRRVSFKPSGAGSVGGRQFNNKPQKNLNLAIRATLDDDDDMVDFPNGLNRDGNVSCWIRLNFCEGIHFNDFAFCSITETRIQESVDVDRLFPVQAMDHLEWEN